MRDWRPSRTSSSCRLRSSKSCIRSANPLQNAAAEMLVPGKASHSTNACSTCATLNLPVWTKFVRDRSPISDLPRVNSHPLPTETIGLRKIKQRQRAHRTVSVPADRVLEAIIAPKKFMTYDESRRTEDAKIPGKARFLHQGSFRFGGFC